jgi:hypothetical protein
VKKDLTLNKYKKRLKDGIKKIQAWIIDEKIMKIKNCVFYICIEAEEILNMDIKM